MHFIFLQIRINSFQWPFPHHQDLRCFGNWKLQCLLWTFEASWLEKCLVTWLFHALFSCHFVTFWSAAVTLMLNTSFKYNLEHRIFTFSVPTWRLCCNSGGKRTDETQKGFICRCETMIGSFSPLTPGLYCQRRSLPPTILSDTLLHIHQARWRELAWDCAAQTRIPACSLASNMKESSINAAPPHIHLAVQFSLSSILTAEKRTIWIFPRAAVGMFRYNQRCRKARIYVSGCIFTVAVLKMKKHQ